MIDGIVSFIVSNATFLATVLGTVVGGLITFLTTITLEKEREKRTARKEKLDNILIPYCTAVEEAERELAKLDKKTYIRKIDLLSNAIKRPLNYLNACNRVYLSVDQRKELEQYRVVFDNFVLKWKNSSELIEKEYTQWVVEQLYRFDGIEYQISDIIVSFASNAIGELKWDLICTTRKSERLIERVERVEFVHSKYDRSGQAITAVSITEAVRNVEDALQAEVYCPEDIIGTKEEMAVRVLEFLKEIDDNEILMKNWHSWQMVNQRSMMYCPNQLKSQRSDLPRLQF